MSDYPRFDQFCDQIRRERTSKASPEHDDVRRAFAEFCAELKPMAQRLKRAKLRYFPEQGEVNLAELAQALDADDLAAQLALRAYSRMMGDIEEACRRLGIDVSTVDRDSPSPDPAIDHLVLAFALRHGLLDRDQCLS